MEEFKVWAELLVKYPTSLLVSVWVLNKMGKFFGPLIREAVMKWVNAHVSLTDSLRIGVEQIAVTLVEIRHGQESHRAETAHGFRSLKESPK